MSRAARPGDTSSLSPLQPEDPVEPSAAQRSAQRAAERSAGRRSDRGAADRTAGARAGERRRIGPWLWAGLALIIALIVIRLVTLSPADVVLETRAASDIRISGQAPTPRWPIDGQAALAVEGIGSLGSSTAATPTPTASLAKVMTAYLILQKYPLTGPGGGFEITVTPADAAAEAADAAQDESVLPVRAGETLDERQLLEGLLIPSGDNVARMLGAYAAGSDGRFVAEMNATARALGMDHTTYTDPSGFAASTLSTAADQLRIFELAMRSTVFRQIVSMPSVTLPVAGTVTNYDPLITEGYAGKTGSDSAAEGCLAFFKVEHVHGRAVTVVGVVMDQGVGSDTDVILDAAGDAAATMVHSILPAIGVHTILPVHSSVILATSASGQRVRALSTRPLSVIGWGGVSEHILVTRARTGTGLAAGTTVGTVTLAGGLPIADGSARSSRVQAASALRTPGLGWRLSHLL